MANESILLVEDADSLREVLKTVLETQGYHVSGVASAEEAMMEFSARPYNLVLSDFKLPAMNGIELLVEVRKSTSTVPFVIMTAFGSIEIAVEAMKQGANEFICKPFEPEVICKLIKDVLQYRRALDRSSSGRERRDRRFITHSAAALAMLDQARKVARVDSSVLILGESGTGKEIVARYIHDQSPRKDAPFLAVNCAALPPDLLESEFFGHEAGSFTGATQTRVGVLEIASEGTIFLDEVGDMPPNLQVKLLRAIQEREIKRVGGTKSIKVNPRIIAATNRDLEASMDSGEMRDDFYYRLAVVTLKIPPLRERPEDIMLLAEFYLDVFSSGVGAEKKELSDEAREVIENHPWPGNARELENAIERAVVLASGVIGPEHLGISLRQSLDALSEASSTLPEIAALVTRKAESEMILRALQRTAGNKLRASELLGVSYKTLLNKIRDYKIDQSHRHQE